MKYFSELFRILGRFGTGRATMLVMALFLNSLLEGIGIATLVPLLTLLIGDGAGQMPPMAVAILDTLRQLGLPQEPWLLLTLSIGLLVLREIIHFAIQIYAGYVIVDMEADLRKRLLDALAHARWPWFQEQHLGGLGYSLVQFTTNAATAMQHAVSSMAVLLRTMVYVGLTIAISPSLFLLISVSVVALFAPLLLVFRLTHKFSSKHALTAENLSAQFSNIFTSIKMIKAMGLEDAVRPLFDSLIQRLRRFHRRILLAMHGLVSLQNTVMIILVSSMLYFAVVWLRIPVVEVGVVAGLVLSIAKNLSRAQRLFQKMVENAPYFERLDEIIRSSLAARESLHGDKPPRLKRNIRFDHVTFAHPGKCVFKDLSFTLPAGRISVLVGPSGAGKTTIIDLITGLQVPDRGRILVDGVPLEDIDLAAWRRMTGYVPQELVLLTGSVRENITLGADYPDTEIWCALELAGAAEFVRELPEGLDTDLGERGVKLSGGQRQRLSLARALVRKPKLLILDEVTSALDPETEQRLVSQIATLARHEGLTVIAITHNDAWQDIADQVLRLENGHVAPAAGGVHASVAE